MKKMQKSGFHIYAIFLIIIGIFIQNLIQHFESLLTSCVKISNLFPSNHLRNNHSESVTVGRAGPCRFIKDINYTVRNKYFLFHNLWVTNQWLPKYRVGWKPLDYGKKFSSTNSVCVDCTKHDLCIIYLLISRGVISDFAWDGQDCQEIFLLYIYKHI